MAAQNYYELIKTKIEYLKENYKCLRNKKDDYAFSALCVKADYYTNPVITFMDVFKEYEQ